DRRERRRDRRPHRPGHRHADPDARRGDVLLPLRHPPDDDDRHADRRPGAGGRRWRRRRADAGGGRRTVTGENIKFDPTSLQASAGSVTVTFDNKDNGVPHNIHFFKGTDASGESVAATDVKSGPATDTLTMNLEAGTYFYHCDIHPTTMKGTLTVQ